MCENDRENSDDFSFGYQFDDQAVVQYEDPTMFVEEAIWRDHTLAATE
jgi:hypothetical protein